MFTRFFNKYRSLPYLDLVLATSVFVIFIRTFEISWFHPLLLSSLLLVVLVFPAVLKRSTFWFITSAGLFFGIAYNWYSIDNHQWLIALWALLLGVLLRFAPPESLQKYIAKNAVLIIALIMLLSIVQKSLEPEFLSGDLFGYTLLVHPDLAYMVSYCPEISDTDLLHNREARRDLLNNELRGTASLRSGPCVEMLSQIITYWVFIIELLIGILLLFPQRTAQALGHSVNIYFIIVTYLAVPVVAFGSLLSVLGIAATHQRFPRLSFIYFLLLFLMVLYILPLQHILQALVNVL